MRGVEFLLSTLVIMVAMIGERGCPVRLEKWDMPKYIILYILLLVVSHTSGG
jgi:hypothetical protein